MNILVPSGCMLFSGFMHKVHGCMYGSGFMHKVHGCMYGSGFMHKVHGCMYGSKVWLFTLTSHIHLHGC